VAAKQSATKDMALTDYFISQKYISAEMRLLNMCRLYLQVVFLSEIVTTDGQRIEKARLKRG
jgi:hypothetical protein